MEVLKADRQHKPPTEDELIEASEVCNLHLDDIDLKNGSILGLLGGYQTYMEHKEGGVEFAAGY